jgi:small subunit ribosomal protein S17
MADEEQKNDEQVEETQDEAATGGEPADEAAEAAPEADEPEDEAPAAEKAPAAPTPPADAASEEDAEPLTPKAIRKAERSRFRGTALPPRGPDERATERAQARRAKGAGRRRYRTGRGRSRGEPRAGTAPAERAPGPKKVRLGKVVSTKADKTITVRIEIVRRHPTYEKVVRRTATLHAHDAANEAQEGDTVRVIETRPLSKTKRWRLMEIVERAR